MKKKLAITMVGCAVALLSFADANAAPIAPGAMPTINFIMETDGVQIGNKAIHNDLTTADFSIDGSGTITLTEPVTIAGLWDGAADITIGSFSYNQNPFVDLNITVKNNSGVTQTFTFVVQTPIAPAILPTSLVGGSVGGSVTDANFDGSATVSTVSGSPLYAGLLDGNTVLTLHDDPSSWTTASTANIPSVSDGLPGPTIPAPGVLSTIGIEYRFTLTPGDTAGLTGNFIVVPEPASLALLALGGVALLARRRS
ncbi:MAG: PEP-CTERM sorting domain-containing protein [Phycisphaeraceae bacterium]|nr:PEP-CTERM sorting domain-containing protein [Phycisphaeraceae bacterium]